ncbi:MAG: hypothetical protein N3A65_04050 [candidate division WOR-3 bacterium]|nr:hypothetical protein [candidate division WOR-3 bacterium]
MSDELSLSELFRIDLTKYRDSYYNIIKRMDDGALLLFNAKTGAFSIIPPESTGKLNEQLLRKFPTNGYVVKKERDELKEIIMSFKKIRRDK